MAAAKQVIKPKVAMAALRADDAEDEPSVHSMGYRRKDYFQTTSPNCPTEQTSA